MLLAELIATLMDVGATRGRRRKIELLAACLRRMSVPEVAVGAAFLRDGSTNAD